MTRAHNNPAAAAMLCVSHFGHWDLNEFQAFVLYIYMCMYYLFVMQLGS